MVIFPLYHQTDFPTIREQITTRRENKKQNNVYKTLPEKRYKNTLRLVRKYLDKSDSILDLGVANPLSELMQKEGFQVTNTQGEDLDEKFSELAAYNPDAITAFEILEHLLNPYSILKNLPADKLLVTVPLRLWFSEPFRGSKNPLTWHFHEFTDWQFDWLLEKTGWEIKHREKWTNPSKKLGIRPVLRSFTPRYYAVYAERKIKI